MPDDRHAQPRDGSILRSRIDHTRTKAKSTQTNGICERFHKTVLNEFCCVAFREKVYSIDELQTDLDALGPRL
jgi:hypothetical protein